MPGPVPGIHDLSFGRTGVVGRDKPGHDKSVFVDIGITYQNGNFCFNHGRSSVVLPEKIGACAEEPQAGGLSMRGLRLTSIVAILLALSMPALGAQTKVAVFEFELIDTSLEGATNGPRADEQRRLSRLAEELRSRLAGSGRYVPVDISPVAEDARRSNLQACGGCDAELARRAGAELAVTGTVQKISNLILNMNIYVRDAANGRLVNQMSADFRGNTDESWSRALDWLVRNRLLAAASGARP
jgi:hypothetical protein